MGLIKALCNGAKLAFFTGKTLFSKSAHNDVIRVLNAFLNIRIHPSTRDAVTYSDNGVAIEYNAQQAAVQSIQIKTYLVKSIGSEHLVCHSWDGVTEGVTNVNIAKSPKLRCTIASEVLSGTTVNYSSYNIASQSRHASDSGGDAEDQYITPYFILNDVIYAAPCATFVSVSGVVLAEMDLNIDGRAWAADP